MPAFCPRCHSDMFLCQVCGKDFCSKEHKIERIDGIGNVCSDCAREMIKCPQCDNGIQHIKVTEIKNGIAIEEPGFDLKCDLCDGKGHITLQQMRYWGAQNKLWCSCGNPSKESKYWEDGTNKYCSKHCWTCKDCGKLTQIG